MTTQSTKKLVAAIALTIGLVVPGISDIQAAEGKWGLKKNTCTELEDSSTTWAGRWWEAYRPAPVLLVLEIGMRASGAFIDGKREGHWFERNDGRVSEGSYTADKREGHWFRKGADGRCKRVPTSMGNCMGVG